MRQKSRALWLKEGNRCTKFFHRVANSNRKANLISRLELEKEVVEDPVGIPVEIVDFYSSLYEEPFYWRPSLDRLEFESISEDDAEWIEKPFDAEEVTKVVHSFNGDKAPDPDSFSLVFYQACWDINKMNLMVMFNEFARDERFVRNLNSSFIVLIPKKLGAVERKDFRPISLVKGEYKILAKVLANRLKLFLNKIISPSQSAFVGGERFWIL